MSTRRFTLLAYLLLFLGIASSTASANGQLPRIGWIYRIEGHLEGSPVLYVGSAADLKQRLTSTHKWAPLLQQNGTKVYTQEVFAELDVPSSNRGTLLSARNEALRAAEQRADVSVHHGPLCLGGRTRLLHVGADPVTVFVALPYSVFERQPGRAKG